MKFEINVNFTWKYIKLEKQENEAKEREKKSTERKKNQL